MSQRRIEKKARQWMLGWEDPPIAEKQIRSLARLIAEVRRETVEEVCKLLWHRHVECRLIRAAFAGKERGE